jgi:hypothetical protein
MREFLESASKIVSTWPKWKQQILGGPMTVDELYERPDCEVTKSVLKNRLAAGEPFETAKRLRNFVVRGKKYKNLWALSKDTTPVLTYQQLLYRIGTLKLSPSKALDHLRVWVDQKRTTGRRSHTTRGANVSVEELRSRLDSCK